MKNEDLTRADLRDAILIRAELEGANLKDALYNDGTEFPPNFKPKDRGVHKITSDADLNKADLNNQDLSNANLSSANLRGTDSKKCELEKCRLDWSQLDWC